MNDREKTKEQLISELEEIRQQTTELVSLKALRKQADELFEGLAISSPVGIYIIQDRKFQYVNPKFQKDTGYSENELLGTDAFEIIVPEDRDIVRKNAVEMLKGQRLSPYEYRSINKVGDIRWILEGVASIKYQGKQATVGTYVDITEQKQAEQTLKESEEKYRDLVENAPSGITVSNVEGQIIDVNKSLLEMAGYATKEEFIKIPVSQHYYNPKDRERFVVLMQEKGKAEGFEVQMKRRDGTTYWASLTSIPRISELREHQFITIVQDINKRKEAEGKLEQYYKQEKELCQSLENEIKKRAKFANTLVHELKTPLVPIIAASELLADEVNEKQLHNMVMSIQRGASTLNSRIDTILDVARGELGTLELEYREIDLLKLLNQVAEEMSSVASNENLSLVLEMPSVLPSVWADEGRLEQVIMNILTNAFKFTPSGGTVTLRAKDKDASLMVEIQDTGPGIAEENWQKIFEAYYRVESSERRPAGLGLGLALCKTIIEAHKGKIWVESKVGKGSTFSFSIPLSKL